MKSRATELKSILNNFVEEYAKRSDQSYKDYIQTLPPGTPLPQKGGFFSSTDKTAFMAQAESMKLKARSVIDDEIRELRGKIAAPPTEEDIRTLTLLNMRTSVGEEELEAYADRFAGSEACYRSLVDIAKKNDYVLPSNRIESRIDNLKELRETVDNAFDWNGTPTQGMADFVGMFFDDYFPE